MKDQNTKITGYRDLSKQEIDLMNEFKALETLVANVFNHAKHDLYNSGHGADYIGEGERCLALARTNFQTAFMWGVRSVAQPQSEL